MFFNLAIFVVLVNAVCFVNSQICNRECPLDKGTLTCGFLASNSSYKMFPSNCALTRFKECYNADIAETSIQYCIKAQKLLAQQGRRGSMYGESCPVFCPSHYRPVCASHQVMSYVYRTFVNGCQLDMVNCRGDDLLSSYVEVPLSYCQNHLMKNIFQEKMVMSNVNEYHDYNVNE